MNTISTTRNASGLRRVRPRALMPQPAILRRFSPDDEELLEHRLSEPAECIFHPIFLKSTVPGDDADLAAVAERFSGPALTRRSTLDGTEAVTSSVLTADEERQVFFRFNYCRYRVIRILRKYAGERLSAGAARELLRWERQGQELRAHIVRANTSLVLAMARRSRNGGVEIGELVSEGNLALLRCVDKFDAARGFKFSTYACRAILASFSRTAAKAARRRAQFPTPYDPMMERSDYQETRREVIEHECVDELKHILFDNSAALTHAERRVLNARFSLDQRTVRPGARRRTLDQVGDLLGFSKERVRQIQNQAMLKLRAVLEERLLVAS